MPLFADVVPLLYLCSVRRIMQYFLLSVVCCLLTVSFSFSQCTLTNTTSQANVLCNGAATGSATITPTGGTLPYTYNWSTGASTSAISNLAAGTYTASVIDASCIVSGVELVTNGDFESGNVGFVSTYTACVPNCAEGSYAVGTNPNAVHTAWAACTDHTSGSGNFMILNGAPTAGVSVWCESITVTPNTNYNFSAWVVSQYTVSPAVLQFSINGIPLCTTYTASSTACVWTQFFCVWNSGASTTANICILNQNTALAGNDFGLDDISFQSCAPCTSTATVTITQPPPLASVNSQVNILCNGGNNGIAAVAVAGGSPPYTYSWNNAQTTSSSTGLIAGNYSVQITDGNNCTLTESFTITEPPPLTITGSTTSEFCNRSDGTATVTPAGGAGAYTYLWTPSGKTSATATGLSAGNYSVTVTDGNGCTHDTSMAVNFTSGPSANSGPDLSMCTGSTVTLSASGGGNYLWSPAAGLSSTTDANPAVTATASTTYSLTVTDANGCTSSDTTTVTVYLKPEVNFSATAVCFNNATVFTDLSTIATPVQWHWDFGDGNTSTLQNPTHTYNSAGIFNVTLVAYTAQGCSDSVSIPVTVHPLPASSFSSTTVCIGSQTCFQDLTTISTGSITAWSWNFGDPTSGANNISNLQSPCHLYSAVGTFSVLLTATSNNGCQSTANLNAIVLPPPVASFTSSVSCLNTATIFTDASTSALNWSWNFGDGGSSTLQNPSHTYLAPGNYSVTLIASSTGSCADTVTNIITVFPLPIVKFKADTVCQGDSTSFFNLSYINTGNITGWHWDFGDGDTSSLKNPSHIYSAAGNYTVTLTATSSNGCAGSLSVPILVYPLPNADFSFIPAPTADLIDPVVFSDLSTGSPVKWWWGFGDGDTSLIQNPSHLYSDTGAFVVTLIVTSNHGCVDTVRHPLDVREFTFYIPNSFSPNGDNVNDLFFGKGLGIKEYEMFIFDRWGNLIFYCKINDLPQTLPCMWDGRVQAGISNKPAQQDVYVWVVNFTNVYDKDFHYMGNVTIIK